MTAVTIDASGPLGTYGGREYTWATGAMAGTVAHDDGTVGHYRVPISLMYPDGAGNVFGFVDVVNSADFWLYSDADAPFGKRKILYLGDIIFSDYLRREGYTYMSVQWAKMVTEVLGPDYGVIEYGPDGYEIVKDAARFLRDPVALQGALAVRPGPVNHVIGFGQSQTAQLLLELSRHGGNRETDDTLVFDGILAGGPAGCLVMDNDPTVKPIINTDIPTYYDSVRCAEPLPDDGRFISILTETALEAWQGYKTRLQLPHFRQYEIAGVAHMPPDMVGLKFMGATRQNPVSFRLQGRAA